MPQIQIDVLASMYRNLPKIADELEKMNKLKALELMLNLAEETDGVSIPICLDDEDMKYDFDNTEKKVNEFDCSTPAA